MKVKYSWYKSISHWGMFKIIEEFEDDNIWFDEVDQKYYHETKD